MSGLVFLLGAIVPAVAHNPHGDCFHNSAAIPDTIDGTGNDDRCNGLVNESANMYGHNGRDVFKGMSGGDFLEMGNGNDEGYGVDQNDTVNGNDGNDDLLGGGGADYVRDLKPQDADRLCGGNGADWMDATDGDTNDFMWGTYEDDMFSDQPGEFAGSTCPL